MLCNKRGPMKSLFLILVTITFFHSGCSYDANEYEKTRYELSCPLNKNDMAYTLNPTYYKIYRREGRAVYNIGGTVAKFTDCSIYDEENWSCTYDDKSGRVTVESGRFIPTYEYGAAASRMYVNITPLTYWKFEILQIGYPRIVDDYCNKMKTRGDFNNILGK